MMSKAKFIFIQNEFADCSIDKINAFVEQLDPNKKGVVNYNDFLALLNEPQLLVAEEEMTGGVGG